MGTQNEGQKRLGSGLGDTCKALGRGGLGEARAGAERAGRHERACPGGGDPGGR